MSVRITHNQIALQFQNDVASVYEAMARTQRQISTGERIERPSDDPFGTSQVLGFDAQIADVEQYQDNVDDAMGFLDTADAALDGVGKALERIRQLVVQASSETNDASARASIAAEITQLKEAVRDSINGQFGDRYMFSGTATGTEPYPAPGNAYAGNLVTMNRRVSPGLSISLNIPGEQVLGLTTGAAPGQLSTLDLIDQIVGDITTGTPASLNQLRTADLDALDARFDQVLQQRTQLGATRARLESTSLQLQDLEERLRDSRSNIADTDMAEAIMQFNNQQTMYQAALSAGTRILNTTILDFI